jgi:hypothetical protein
MGRCRTISRAGSTLIVDGLGTLLGRLWRIVTRIVFNANIKRGPVRQAKDRLPALQRFNLWK